MLITREPRGMGRVRKSRLDFGLVSSRETENCFPFVISHSEGHRGRPDGDGGGTDAPQGWVD